MISAVSFVSQNLALLYIPAGAAVLGLGLGRLIRGRTGATPGLQVTRTTEFVVRQKSGTVHGRKIVLSTPDTHQPVEEFYEMHVPTNMPKDQREDSMRQASAS